jgi:hypothetical protein
MLLDANFLPFSANGCPFWLGGESSGKQAS